jgi:hypothetical protein
VLVGVTGALGLEPEALRGELSVEARISARVPLGARWALSVDGVPYGYRFAQNAAIAADDAAPGPFVAGLLRTLFHGAWTLALFARVRPPSERGALRYGGQLGVSARVPLRALLALDAAFSVEALVAQPGARAWVQAGGALAWELRGGPWRGWSLSLGAELRWLPTLSPATLGAVWLSGRWTSRGGWFTQLAALRAVDRAAPEDLRAELSLGRGW